MYERTFRMNGYEVVCAYDGEEALQKLKAPESLPSVILLDVIIPKISGLDVLRSIRKDPRFDNVPVVVLTNSFAEENEEQFMTLGADLYLVKIKYQAKEVLEKVEALVKKREEEKKA